MYFWSVSLVYQLSGQFLIFLVDQIFFWFTKYFSLVYQNFFWSTKFVFGRPKKLEIDRTIGIPETDQKYMDATLVDQREKINLLIELIVGPTKQDFYPRFNILEGNYCFL